MPIVQNSPYQLQPGAASRDVACLVVRVIAGLSMILYNSWLMVDQGWEHLWREGEWMLLNVVTNLGLPMPVVVACVIASIYFFGSIFLILGVFGRVTSALLLITTEIGCYLALRGGAIAYVELSLLYGTLYVLHLILGSGRISLDQVLAGIGRKRFRERNPAEF
jgi:uncharacterized membrane protein YphA (DoxX/SURF4 family)